jgi:hypothetical protein
LASGGATRLKFRLPRALRNPRSAAAAVVPTGTTPAAATAAEATALAVRGVAAAFGGGCAGGSCLWRTLGTLGTFGTRWTRSPIFARRPRDFLLLLLLLLRSGCAFGRSGARASATAAATPAARGLLQLTTGSGNSLDLGTSWPFLRLRRTWSARALLLSLLRLLR